jgi:hypothetical protein
MLATKTVNNAGQFYGASKIQVFENRVLRSVFGTKRDRACG